MTDVIIGAGAAGVGCVETIRRYDADRHLTVVAPESGPPYSRPMLYYALAKTITLEGIHFRRYDFYRENTVNFVQGRVEKIDTAEKLVLLNDGSEVKFENLVIAAGGRPRYPQIEGVDKKGVTTFRNIEDLKAIIEYAEKAESAIILGGGNIGLQAAEGLQRRGLKCTVVVKSPNLLSQLADPETGNIFRAHLEANGIDIITGADVVEIIGRAGVEGVVLDDGRKISCQLVVVGKGIKPDLSFVEDSGIKCNWGILADDYMMTSIAGIYCAGDVAEVKDRITGERTTVGIWPAAFEQGKYAAWNIMGHKKPYPGAVRMNSSEFFGLNLISLGVVNPKSDDFQIFTIQRGKLYRKLVMKSGKLWGAILVGDIKGAGVLNSLIKSQVDITSIIDDLAEGEIDFGKIYALLQKAELKYYSREHYELINKGE